MHEDQLSKELEALPLATLPAGFTAHTMQRVRQYELEQAYKKPVKFLDIALPAFLSLFVGCSLFFLWIVYQVIESPLGLELRSQLAYWTAALTPTSSLILISTAALGLMMALGMLGLGGVWLYQTNRDQFSAGGRWLF